MTFPSVYEMFDPLTTVRKQRFWDWFSGDALRSIWRVAATAGSPTNAMADEADGGYSMATGATSGNNDMLDFTDKRPFSNTDSVMICVAKRVSGSMDQRIGMTNSRSDNIRDNVHYCDFAADTYKKFHTGDTSATNTFTDTSVAVDTNWTSFKIEMSGGTSADLYISGVSEATRTSLLPTKKMQPWSYIVTNTSSSAEQRLRYVECYNT